MTILFRYPDSTALKRVVPKSRIYERAEATTALKDRFVKEVDQITWAYKLAPETLNLPATKSVTEMQVFRVTLKVAAVSEDILKAIDKAIPFPIIFELHYDGQIQVAAAHKRPSEAVGYKWVMSAHLRGEWVDKDAPRHPLPVALNIGRLYEQILATLIPIETTVGEDMATRLARFEAVKAKGRDITRLEAKLKRETQFNIKVGLHGQLAEAQAAFELMKKPDQTGGET